MSRRYKGNLEAQVRERYCNRCCNCGATDHLNIHHIVPTKRGGVDSVENLVLVCQRCHQAIHYGQNVAKYKTHENDGRPRQPIAVSDMIDYIHANITGAELLRRNGFNHSTKIAANVTYKDFLKSLGIKKIYRVPYSSTLYYEDGTVERWIRGICQKTNEQQGQPTR